MTFILGLILGLLVGSLWLLLLKKRGLEQARLEEQDSNSKKLTEILDIVTKLAASSKEQIAELGHVEEKVDQVEKHLEEVQVEEEYTGILEVVDGACKEQTLFEMKHPVPYANDQRIQAIFQRCHNRLDALQVTRRPKKDDLVLLIEKELAK